MCGQVGRPLLDRGVGGRSPGYLLLAIPITPTKNPVFGIRTPSFVFWRKLLKQVRPIARDNTAYLVIDGGDVVEARLNMPTEHFQFFGTERATV
jgi:hypothetical protein